MPPVGGVQLQRCNPAFGADLNHLDDELLAHPVGGVPKETVGRPFPGGGGRDAGYGGVAQAKAVVVDGGVGDVLEAQQDFLPGPLVQRYRFRLPAAAFAGVAGAVGQVQRVVGTGEGGFDDLPGGAAVGRRLQVGEIPIGFDGVPDPIGQDGIAGLPQIQGAGEG